MTGAGEDDGSALEPPTFDPRHDARFQRGYQPGDGRAAATGRPAAATGSPTDTPAAPAPPTRDTSDSIEALDLTALDADTFPDELEPSRWNPFIALLWPLGLLFSVGGLMVQWQAVQGMYGNNSYSGNGEPPMSMFLQQFSYLAAPPIITSGILIIVGLMFWHAFTWRARRASGPRN